MGESFNLPLKHLQDAAKIDIISNAIFICMRARHLAVVSGNLSSVSLVLVTYDTDRQSNSSNPVVSWVLQSCGYCVDHSYSA